MMLECPVCDFPESKDLQNILERLTNTKLIVTLACDFAERVCNLISNHTEAKEWLRTTRDWRSRRRTATVTTAKAARSASAQLLWAKETKAERDALLAIAWAADTANWACRVTEAKSLPEAKEAGRAAEAATGETDDPEAERAWQLEHTRRLVCYCPVWACPDEPRSRKSLLSR